MDYLISNDQSQREFCKMSKVNNGMILSRLLGIPLSFCNQLCAISFTIQVQILGIGGSNIQESTLTIECCIIRYCITPIVNNAKSSL